MKRIKCFVVVITTFLSCVSILYFDACTASKNSENRSLYKFIGIDTNSLVDMNVITLIDSNKNRYFVLSHKSLNADSCHFKRFDILSRSKEEKVYRLALTELIPPVTTKSTIVGTNDIHLYINETFFWYKDTIRVKVYESQSICDKFMELNDR